MYEIRTQLLQGPESRVRVRWWNKWKSYTAMVSLKLNCKVTRLVIAIKITFTLVKCLTFILLVLAINQLPKISLGNLVLLLSNTFKSNWFTEIEKLLLKRSIKLGMCLHTLGTVCTTKFLNFPLTYESLNFGLNFFMCLSFPIPK